MTVAVFVVVPGEGGGGSGDPSRPLLVRPPRSRTRPPSPGNELHEGVVERDAGVSIEDGRVGVAHKVRGDDLGVQISEISVGRGSRSSRSPGSDS